MPALDISRDEAHEVHEFAGRELMCELRKTSMVLYGMFVELVRGLYRFQEPYLVGTPDVVWDRDPARTRVWIDTELNWNQEHPEMLPAIFVRLGDIQYSSATGGAPAPMGMMLKDGIYRSLRTGSTTVSFMHVGNSEGEACMLCDNTRAYLSDFAMPIRRDFVLTKFHEVQATPMRQHRPDSKERWQSSATFAVEWEEETRIKLESPILRSVDVDALKEHSKYGILSTRRVMPDQHQGEQR